ncbi:hypothetical protein [Candidatus Berkiella aquae]|uniref:Uncharacterized protein n=1 Tax=Candidatus Berkiella aquae TaxID=295108 RepID=A0A0Q9YWW3_9GAMM|nr:hypothetical protein [Candidatus Berkiella aquae]MCS5710236.1 hypothetical protein [Candidatus Berkiella aquae]
MSIISEEKMAAYLPAFELHKAILNEQQGLNPNEETALRESLQLNGINLHSDILHGNEIDLKTRLFWQEMGIDPDSEDEVYDLLRRLGIEDYPQTPGVTNKKLLMR